MTITKDTVIGDILKIAPQAAPLFMGIGMHCLGCPASGRDCGGGLHGPRRGCQRAAVQGQRADRQIRPQPPSQLGGGYFCLYSGGLLC